MSETLDFSWRRFAFAPNFMTFVPNFFICAKNGMTFAPISDMTFAPNRYSSGFKIRLKLWLNKINGNKLKYSGGFSVRH